MSCLSGVSIFQAATKIQLMSEKYAVSSIFLRHPFTVWIKPCKLRIGMFEVQYVNLSWLIAIQS